MQSQIANEEDYVLFGEKQASKKALEFCSRHRDKSAVIFPTVKEIRDNSCYTVLSDMAMVRPSVRGRRVQLVQCAD